MGGVDQMENESLDLEAIEARANAATEGPWGTYAAWGSRGVDDSEGGMLFIETYGATHAAWAPDADFIAHAREDVPALIAEVRRLREASDDIRAEERDRIAAAILADEQYVAALRPRYFAPFDSITRSFERAAEIARRKPLKR